MRLPLVSKGIRYGHITALPSGDIDKSEIDGVDPDLRVRPFFAQGGTISIREFINGALKAEMGLEAVDPVLCAATDPTHPTAVVTPAGMVLDPTLDRLERPAACDAAADGDNDGVVNEVDGARFAINVIPHTLSVTTLGLTGPGSRLNFEADLLARYVARLTQS